MGTCVFGRNVNLLVKNMSSWIMTHIAKHKSILLKFGTDINEPILYSENKKTLE